MSGAAPFMVFRWLQERQAVLLVASCCWRCACAEEGRDQRQELYYTTTFEFFEQFLADFVAPFLPSTNTAVAVTASPVS